MLYKNRCGCFLFCFFVIFNGVAFGQEDIDFSYGYLPNWDLYLGDGNSQPSISTTDFLMNSELFEGRHSVNTFNRVDVNTDGQLKCMPEGELYSTRLGNSDNGSQSEKLAYTFTVDASNHQGFLYYKYALVHQNPQNYTPNLKPKFKIQTFVNDVLTETYTSLNDSELNINRSSGSVPVMWKDWTSVSYDLSTYNIDDEIRLEFENYDCATGRYFGYAYLVAGYEDAVSVTDDLSEVAEGCADATACNYNETSIGDKDKSLCIYPKGCESCSGATDGTGYLIDNDADSDGFCDDDEVVGCMDIVACNFNVFATDLDNSSCVYAKGCESCSGAKNGTGYLIDNDADADGVCDADEVPGCADVLACNFNSMGTNLDNESCIYPKVCESCSGATDGTGYLVDNDIDDDGVCDGDEVLGCTDVLACNFNLIGTDMDGRSCVYAKGCESCSGATDGTGYIIDNDVDDDGICDTVEFVACIDVVACNYNHQEHRDHIQAKSIKDIGNDFCIYPGRCDLCSGETNGTGFVIDNDIDDDGVCDKDEVSGCTDVVACNFNAFATDLDEFCIYPSGCDVCSGSTDGTGFIIGHDTDNDGICNDDEVGGCTDVLACNFNVLATDDLDEFCVYAKECDLCSGENDGTGYVIDNDVDNDGICDEDELAGCIDIVACNYNHQLHKEYIQTKSTAHTDHGFCIYASKCDDCSGDLDGTGFVIDSDAADDGVCDSDEVLGCTDALACNYDSKPSTDTDMNLCIYSDKVCESCSGANDGTGFVAVNDADGDGVCDANELEGCIDAIACNYDSRPTTDMSNDLCIYAKECDHCSGESDGSGFIVNNDSDSDGVCDKDEVIGCTDATACNYDAKPTTDTDNDLCIYSMNLFTVERYYEADSARSIIDNRFDNDCVCNLQDVLLSAVFFDLNSKEISYVNDKKLAIIAFYLKSNPTYKLRAIGYADVTSNSYYNYNLALDRAKVVVDVLSKKYGVNRCRLKVESRGEKYPLLILKNGDKSSKMNRRVQFAVEMDSASL